MSTRIFFSDRTSARNMNQISAQVCPCLVRHFLSLYCSQVQQLGLILESVMCPCVRPWIKVLLPQLLIAANARSSILCLGSAQRMCVLPEIKVLISYTVFYQSSALQLSGCDQSCIFTVSCTHNNASGVCILRKFTMRQVRLVSKISTVSQDLSHYAKSDVMDYSDTLVVVLTRNVQSTLILKMRKES